MISTNDFKTGVTVEIDGDAWQVVEFQHVKPGERGSLCPCQDAQPLYGCCC